MPLDPQRLLDAQREHPHARARRGRARGDVDRRRERHRAARRAARHRHAAARRHRHVARRHPGRDRRLGRRRLLLRHAEVPRRAAGPLAGDVLAARGGADPDARAPAAVVVPRRVAHRQLRRGLAAACTTTPRRSRWCARSTPRSARCSTRASTRPGRATARWARVCRRRCPSSGSASSCPTATACRSSPPRWLPEGADDAGLRKALLTTYGIEVGGGLGEFAGPGVAHRPHGPLRARAVGDHPARGPP